MLQSDLYLVSKFICFLLKDIPCYTYQWMRSASWEVGYISLPYHDIHVLAMNMLSHHMIVMIDRVITTILNVTNEV